MLRFRDRGARGRTHGAFVESRHSFSFGDYRDPAQMGFRSLRVINEDWLVPGAGFPPHRHQDMEILTYVLGGQVEHADSLGNRAVIRAGEVQRLSAGTGIEHSERNPDPVHRAHLLQIWIVPASRGLDPGYAQARLPVPGDRPVLQLIASGDGQDGSLVIHQDARIYRATVPPGAEIGAPLQAHRHGWVQVVRGIAEVGGGELREGDGLAVSEEAGLCLASPAVGAELLVFDLA